MNSLKLSSVRKLLMVLGIVLVVVAIFYAALHNDQAVNNNPNSCVNRSFGLGASGNCVKDGQNLLNWYLYGTDQPNYLLANGTFNHSTVVAVQKAQSGASLAVNGQLNPATWKLLCQGDAPPPWWTTSAKNAGCPV